VCFQNVDIVYIGSFSGSAFLSPQACLSDITSFAASPNSHHYPNARSALLAGKGVLCEKGFTVNAAQAEDLVRISREKNVYLHEALWTRHFPATIKLQEVIKEGKIGKVHRVLSDYGGNVGLDGRSICSFGKSAQTSETDCSVLFAWKTWTPDID
jgi:hypothetical protein